MASASSSSSSAPKVPDVPDSGVSAAELAELDKLLSREAAQFNRELEIERIVKAFKLNPYDVLDIEHGADEKTVKAVYRKKSLLIHPDKVKHERAVEAFDLLKKAEAELMDPERRSVVDDAVSDARLLVLRELKLPPTTPDDHPTLLALQPPLAQQVRQKTREVLIDSELRRRRAIKNQMAYEGMEAKKKEDEVTAKKRKAEEAKEWEERRDDRVSDWRSFQKEGLAKKKKKKKLEVLG